MEKQTFLAMVLASVLELKDNATNEEVARLDFATFNSASYNSCVLGQLTWNAHSDRAEELAEKSLRLNSFSIDKSFYVDNSYNNGLASPFKPSVLHHVEEGGSFAAFEIFIMIHTSNVEDLFKFLKGEVDSFTPTYED